MNKTTNSRPRVKGTSRPVRFCSLSDGDGGFRRILTLRVGRQRSAYWFQPIQADWGQGFELEKFVDGEVYHVHLDRENGHSCTCRGFLRWDHCKHVDSLLALAAKGMV